MGSRVSFVPDAPLAQLVPDLSHVHELEAAVGGHQTRRSTGASGSAGWGKGTNSLTKRPVQSTSP